MMRVRRRRLRVNEKWEHNFLWFKADTGPLIIIIMWEERKYVGHRTKLWRHDTLKMVVQAQSHRPNFELFFFSFLIRFHIIQSIEYIFGDWDGRPGHGTKRLPPLSHLLLFIHLFIVIERCAHYRINTLYYVCTASRSFAIYFPLVNFAVKMRHTQ